jgi:signal peptidase I
MDINLPLILMVAVVVSGIIWVLDILFWAKPRARAVSQVESQFVNLSEAERAQNKGYLIAIAAAAKEPTLVEYSKSFFPILAIVFVLRSFLIEPFKIPSESMVPTLEVGDFIAVNKFAYGIRLPVFGTKIIDIGDPQRGDVVVFFPPHEERYFIKRLVGLPGDEIRYKDNELYVNGEHIKQDYIEDDPRYRSGSQCWGDSYSVLNETLGDHAHRVRKCSTAGRAWNSRVWKVPEGHYFMMGDNRDNSLDSRAWPDPFVPDKNIVGKAFAVWMHWSDGLPTLGRTGSIE